MKLVADVNEKLKGHLKITGKSPETMRGYYQNNLMFNEFLIDKYKVPVYIDEVKASDIEEYMHSLKVQKGYQPASVNRHLNATRALFKFSARQRWVVTNPASQVEQLRVNRKKPEFLTSKEMGVLIKAINHPIGQTVARTLAYTGLRITECLNLTIKNIDLKNNIIHVINGKGGKDRDVPLPKSLKTYLKYYLDKIRPKTDSPFLFATKKTGRFSAVYMNRILKEAVKELGWQRDITCHTLRHSFASILVNEKGASLSHVAEILGHEDYRTITSLYVHSTEEQLKEAVHDLDFNCE